MIRFIKAFLWSLLAYLALGFVAKVVIVLVSHSMTQLFVAILVVYALLILSYWVGKKTKRKQKAKY